MLKINIRNFKLQIALITSLVFIFLWFFNFFFLRKTLEDSFIENKRSEIDYNITVVKNHIDELIDSGFIILNNISKRMQREPPSEKENYSRLPLITTIWKNNLIDNEVYALSWYDKSHTIFDTQVNKNLFLEKKPLSDDILRRASRMTSGMSLFSCDEICSLYILNPMSPYNTEDGLLQLDVPVDYIIKKLMKVLDNFNITILKKTESGSNNRNSVLINNNHYVIESSSNTRRTESILTQFNKINDNIYYTNNKEYLLIQLFKGFERHGIIILLEKNISDDIENKNNFLSNTAITSFAIMLFIIVLLNWMLSKSMKRLKILSDTFLSIGSGQFHHAKETLHRIKREKIFDEMDLIYNSAFDLTGQLEEMHDNLSKKNIQLSTSLSEMSFLANHDPLTGLYNRRKFSEELTRVYRTNRPFALVAADLNHFKLVNDSLGHQKGDELLVAFSGVLKDTVGCDGIIGRTGGDEFSIIILSTDRILIENILNLLCQQVKQISISTVSDIKTSTSLGLALFPDFTTDLDELNSFSDIAMYENKRLKLSNFNYYTGNETILRQERLNQYWYNVISNSLNENKLHVFYQPIVHNKNSDKIFAYEALVRILSRDSFIPAMDFISYAEKNNLIIEIDRIVIKKSIRDMSKMDTLSKLSINLSYTTISSANIIDYINECVFASGLSPKNIVFEITESIEVSNFPLVKEFIFTLNNYGFSFALDDFGAGFSSLSYLAKLKISYLKIDKEIILGLKENPADRSIVEAIILLSNQMNIEVIAEGIENKTLLGLISTYDIAFLQGNALSRARSYSETRETVSARLQSEKHNALICA